MKTRDGGLQPRPVASQEAIAAHLVYHHDRGRYQCLGDGERSSRQAAPRLGSTAGKPITMAAVILCYEGQGQMAAGAGQQR